MLEDDLKMWSSPLSLETRPPWHRLWWWHPGRQGRGCIWLSLDLISAIRWSWWSIPRQPRHSAGGKKRREREAQRVRGVPTVDINSYPRISSCMSYLLSLPKFKLFTRPWLSSFSIFFWYWLQGEALSWPLFIFFKEAPIKIEDMLLYQIQYDMEKCNIIPISEFWQVV